MDVVRLNDSNGEGIGDPAEATRLEERPKLFAQERFQVIAIEIVVVVPVRSGFLFLDGQLLVLPEPQWQWHASSP
jgi:hypothetical protein